jgi:hypothetical protein
VYYHRGLPYQKPLSAVRFVLPVIGYRFAWPWLASFVYRVVKDAFHFDKCDAGRLLPLIFNTIGAAGIILALCLNSDVRSDLNEW